MELELHRKDTVSTVQYCIVQHPSAQRVVRGKCFTVRTVLHMNVVYCTQAVKYCAFTGTYVQRPATEEQPLANSL